MFDHCCYLLLIIIPYDEPMNITGVTTHSEKEPVQHRQAFMMRRNHRSHRSRGTLRPGEVDAPNSWGQQLGFLLRLQVSKGQKGCLRTILVETSAEMVNI